jgi:Holliday junction resolvase RusA-like endonuclease
MEKMNPDLLNIYRRKKKYIDLHLQYAPKSKKATSTDERKKMQREVVAIMKKIGKKRLSGKIAIDVQVYASKPNLPNIENYMKNLLDILHKPEYLDDSCDAEFLPFGDDKDIAYIHARYAIAGDSPSIFIKIRPFTSFVSDVVMLNKAEKNGNHYHEDAIDSYNDIIGHEDDYVALLGESGYENLKKLRLGSAQDHFSENSSITPLVIESMSFARRPKNGIEGVDWIFRQNEAMMDAIMRHSIRIQLPSIPIRTGDDDSYKDKYKREIRTILEEYRSRHSMLLEAIMSPLTVSAYYQRPGTVRAGYKDLDNIMREYIIPLMNDVFSPPTSYMNLGMGKELAPGSSIGYEVLEIGRSKASSPEGFIAIGLKMESFGESIMQKASDYIDNYVKECKRR